MTRFTKDQLFGDDPFRATIPGLDDALSMWDFTSHHVVQGGPQRLRRLTKLLEFVTFRSSKGYPEDWDIAKRPLLRRWINRRSSGGVLLVMAVMNERINRATGWHEGREKMAKRKRGEGGHDKDGEL